VQLTLRAHWHTSTINEHVTKKMSIGIAFREKFWINPKVKLHKGFVIQKNLRTKEHNLDEIPWSFLMWKMNSKFFIKFSCLLLFFYIFYLCKVSPQRRNLKVLFLNTKKMNNKLSTEFSCLLLMEDDPSHKIIRLRRGKVLIIRLFFRRFSFWSLVKLYIVNMVSISVFNFV